jgi:hypothetical protein
MPKTEMLLYAHFLSKLYTTVAMFAHFVGFRRLAQLKLDDDHHMEGYTNTDGTTFAGK